MADNGEIRDAGACGAAMGTPPVVAFVGRSGSGKTVLIERVVRRLADEGVRVGTIKHHGHRGFGIDVESKDSWRHRQAGSSHVMIVSPDMVASYRDLRQELSLERALEEFDDVDIVVVEGFRASGLPTIVVARAANPREQAEPTHLGADSHTQHIEGVVTDIDSLAQEAREQGIACVSFGDIERVTRMAREATGLALAHREAASEAEAWATIERTVGFSTGLLAPPARCRAAYACVGKGE